MKKLWSTPEFVRSQAIRIRRAERRLLPLRGAHRRRRTPAGVQSRPEDYTIKAPECLCLFEDPDSAIKLCNEVRRALRRPRARAYLDLSEVTKVGSDALLVIRAAMREGRARRASLSGNLPHDPASAAMVKQSGFFQGFAKPPGDLPEPLGIMQHKSNVRVESDVAADLVAFAQQHADIPKATADVCYKTLVELMKNTYQYGAARNGQHAQARARWSASVYCENGEAVFVFVDLGVGILKTGKPQRLLATLKTTLSRYGDAHLLQNVFEGTYGASIDKPGHGYGLTRLHRDATNLPNLAVQVLTSRLVGAVDRLNFRRLSVGFAGTVFRWRAAASGDE